ncbi:MAG: hydrogenase maturation protease [Thiothrix sp.]|uniref:hydrogenase maturation protease n=1 Tax=Thiothrix sp. TaxID=1032 RepID=UPI002634C49E|nr:hydrogenase maturation protease [Thiothrix sp.]MDD5392749.1 hydrogenase maturation protease [Thiothrix sp.]
MSAVPPILLFGYGNPGRGDDALGVLLQDAITVQQLPGVECQTDMQLQVEHITDLEGREYVLFIDADVGCAEPYVLETLTAQQDGSYTSHAMSPAAVLHAFRQVYGKDAPPAYLLRIRGYSFELGEGISAQAAENLHAALQATTQMLIGIGQTNGVSYENADQAGYRQRLVIIQQPCTGWRVC